MSVLTDACFTNLEVTKNIICNDQVLVDTDRNILGANVVECNTLRYRNLEVSDGTSSATRDLFSTFTTITTATPTTNDNNLLWTERSQGDQNVYSEEIGALTVGGQMNEASGEYAVCVGGRYNESAGIDAVVVGGRENQATGECSISMGVSAMATHDRSFVWNANIDTPAETTSEGQFMVGADMLLFKLPDSTSIKTHMVPEGYACWCWDTARNTLCLKTKQQNVFYKTHLETLVHEIQVKIEPETGNVILVNPDDS